MPVKPRPVIDRLMPRVTEDDNGCWNFQGAKTEGYGVIGLGGRDAGNDYTHRVTYRYFVGEIPSGLDLDHLCRNRACCNPWHVEPVTRLVNTSRGLRWHLPRCKNGHDYTPENTRYRPDGGRRCLACRRESTLRATAAYDARKKAAA